MSNNRAPTNEGTQQVHSGNVTDQGTQNPVLDREVSEELPTIPQRSTAGQGTQIPVLDREVPNPAGPIVTTNLVNPTWVQTNEEGRPRVRRGNRALHEAALRRTSPVSRPRRASLPRVAAREPPTQSSSSSRRLRPPPSGPPPSQPQVNTTTDRFLEVLRLRPDLATPDIMEELLSRTRGLRLRDSSGETGQQAGRRVAPALSSGAASQARRYEQESLAAREQQQQARRRTGRGLRSGQGRQARRNDRVEAAGRLAEGRPHRRHVQSPQSGQASRASQREHAIFWARQTELTDLGYHVLRDAELNVFRRARVNDGQAIQSDARARHQRDHEISVQTSRVATRDDGNRVTRVDEAQGVELQRDQRDQAGQARQNDPEVVEVDDYTSGRPLPASLEPPSE